jgi:class 3 adenylate cyclase
MSALGGEFNESTQHLLILPDEEVCGWRGMHGHGSRRSRRLSCLAGIAVHIGARVSALAGSGEILVSQTVRDLVAGSGLSFNERGKHHLKGVPDEWRLFEAVLD